MQFEFGEGALPYIEPGDVILTDKGYVLFMVHVFGLDEPYILFNATTGCDVCRYKNLNELRDNPFINSIVGKAVRAVKNYNLKLTETTG
jgi:hypothetical protein